MNFIFGSLSICLFTAYLPFYKNLLRAVYFRAAYNICLILKHKNLIANIVTSGIFASIHIHLSPGFAFIVIVPSLLWGWLYSRHNTLVGPVVSHILIGWWAIFGLGIIQLLSAHGC